MGKILVDDGMQLPYIEDTLKELGISVNDLDGILMLGICYYDGCGVVKNTDLGKQYLKNAADQGNKYAAEILDDIVTNERIGKTFNAIDKVAPYIPFFGIGWKLGKAGVEAVGAIVDAIGSFSD